MDQYKLELHCKYYIIQFQARLLCLPIKMWYNWHHFVLCMLFPVWRSWTQCCCYVCTASGTWYHRGLEECWEADQAKTALHSDECSPSQGAWRMVKTPIVCSEEVGDTGLFSLIKCDSFSQSRYDGFPNSSSEWRKNCRIDSLCASISLFSWHSCFPISVKLLSDY